MNLPEQNPTNAETNQTTTAQWLREHTSQLLKGFTLLGGGVLGYSLFSRWFFTTQTEHVDSDQGVEVSANKNLPPNLYQSPIHDLLSSSNGLKINDNNLKGISEAGLALHYRQKSDAISIKKDLFLKEKEKNSRRMLGDQAVDTYHYRPTGEEVIVNGYSGNRKLSPCILSLNNGYVIAWTENTNIQEYDNGRIYIQHYDLSHNLIDKKTISFHYNTGSIAMAQLINGDYVVVWADYHIRIQRFDANSNALGSPFILDPATNRSRSYPSITSLNNGDIVVTWCFFDNWTDTDVYGRRYDINFNPLGSTFSVNSYISRVQDYPTVIGLTNGNFVITWRSYGSSNAIYAKCYDSIGNTIGDELKIDTSSAIIQPPVISELNNSNFVISWPYADVGEMERYNVYAQRYFANCTTSGNKYRVNTEQGGWNPAIARLNENGDHIISWSRYEQQQSTIYARRYDANGNTLQNEFKVNNYLGNQPFVPAVTALKNSDLITIWLTTDAYNSKIYARYYKLYRNTNPTLLTNQLIITKGQTLIITTDNINASDQDNDLLTFIVSNVQHGQFIDAQGNVLSSFTLAQIAAGQIRFKHDDSKIAPSYRISINDGWTSIEAVNAEVQLINSKPSLLRNSLTVNLNLGRKIILTDQNLLVSDDFSSDSQLIFTVSNVNYGYFAFVQAPDKAINSFNQQQINDKEIQFIHTGQPFAPSYSISVSDGQFSTDPVSAEISWQPKLKPQLSAKTKTIIIAASASAGGCALLTMAGVAVGVGYLGYRRRQTKLGLFAIDKSKGIKSLPGLDKDIELNDIVKVESISEEKSLESDGYFQQGNNYFAEQCFQEADLAFAKAIELNPTKAEYYVMRANTRGALGDDKQALNMTLKAIELEPSLSKQLLDVLFDSDPAIGYRQENLNTAGYYCFMQGNVYLKLKRYEKAVQAMAKAIESNPEESCNYFGLGQAYFEMQSFQEASTAFSKAIALSPKRTDFYVRQAHTYLKLERVSDAIAMAHAIIKLDSELGQQLLDDIELQANGNNHINSPSL